MKVQVWVLIDQPVIRVRAGHLSPGEVILRSQHEPTQKRTALSKRLLFSFC